MNALVHYRTELDYADAPPRDVAEIAGERLRGEPMNVTSRISPKPSATRRP